jgi:hypothetical protein
LQVNFINANSILPNIIICGAINQESKSYTSYVSVKRTSIQLSISKYKVQPIVACNDLVSATLSFPQQWQNISDIQQNFFDLQMLPFATSYLFIFVQQK